MSENKSEYEIKMGVIDDGGCIGPLIAALGIAAIVIAAISTWLVG